MKNTKIMYLLILVLGIFTACNAAADKGDSTKEKVSVVHKLGTTEVPAAPERIVVLDIGALETLNELGVKPVGIPKKFLPNYLDSLKDDAQIEDVGSVIEPNFEAISALNPDLILISTRQEKFYKELSDIAPTVFIGTDSKDYLNSFREQTLLLGRIANKEAEAQEKLDAIQQVVAAEQAKFDANQGKGMFLIYNNGRYSAFGKGSRFGFIHDVLHVKPVMKFDDESVHGQQVSSELIAKANPDYLFIVDRNAAVLGKIANKEEMENPLIKQTNAAKQNKIFYLDPNVWFISGGGLSSVRLMVQDIEALKLNP